MGYAVIADMPYLDHENPPHIGVIATLEAWQGRAVDAAYLAGVSGEAWRFLVSGPNPDIEAPFAEATGTLLQGLAAVGLQCRHRDEMTVPAAMALIRHEIDAERPVLAVGTEGWGDWGIVAGYDGDKELLCRNAVARSGEYRTVSAEALAFRGPAGCETVTLGERSDPPDQRQLVLSALAEAVLWFTSTRRGGLYSGRAAYEQWIAGLQDMDLELDYATQANVITWARAKTLAAGFIEQLPTLLMVRDADLHAAAEQYDILARNWDALRGLFGIGQEDNLRDPRCRRNGANILRDALTAERKAIDRIREALPRLADDAGR